jgi:pimeloyl-ACP methyl ester carboxylesterase
VAGGGHRRIITDEVIVAMTSEVIVARLRRAYLWRRRIDMRRRDFLKGAAALAAGFTGCAGRSGKTANVARALDGKPLDAAAYRATRRFARTRYGKIAYLERGDGPAALFVHGFPLNGFQWRGAIDRLSPYRRCVAPDLMGLGYTEVAPGQSVAPVAQAEMLVTFLDTLAISTVDLIANDSGGAVAQLIVTKHPQRVRTILFTNCDTEPDSPPPALQVVLEMARQGTLADRWFAPWVADHALARSKQALGGQAYSDPSRPSDEAIDYYLGPLVASPERKALVHAYTLALSPNPLAGIERALKKCQAPARIVWGTSDDIFSQASPDYLDRTLPHSRGVRRVPGAKLFFPEEYPDLIAEEARRLWAAPLPRRSAFAPDRLVVEDNVVDEEFVR